MDRRGMIADLELGDRASRVPIALTLRYRPGGEVGWSEAKTINISRSGVLFAADESLEIDTPVEMNFDLPLEVGGAPGTGVICRGHVVRTILPPASDQAPAVAVSIDDYRFGLS
jgi:hypothetical protein